MWLDTHTMLSSIEHHRVPTWGYSWLSNDWSWGWEEYYLVVDLHGNTQKISYKLIVDYELESYVSSPQRDEPVIGQDYFKLPFGYSLEYLKRAGRQLT